MGWTEFNWPTLLFLMGQKNQTNKQTNKQNWFWFVAETGRYQLLANKLKPAACMRFFIFILRGLLCRFVGGCDANGLQVSGWRIRDKLLVELSEWQNLWAMLVIVTSGAQPRQSSEGRKFPFFCNFKSGNESLPLDHFLPTVFKKNQRSFVFGF